MSAYLMKFGKDCFCIPMDALEDWWKITAPLDREGSAGPPKDLETMDGDESAAGLTFDVLQKHSTSR